jgi:hypothetical protein
MVGPTEDTAEVLPHPVVVDKNFHRDSSICGKCHVGTYEETKEFSDAKSCQECHMQAVRRKNTQSTDLLSKILVAFENEVDGRRHDFSLERNEFPDDAITVKAFRNSKSRKQLTVEVTNSTPHNIPTGDFGVRTVVLNLVVKDGAGKPLKTIQESLHKELGKALAPRHTTAFKFQVPAHSRLLTVKLWRMSRSGKDRLDLFKKELAID